MFLEELFEKVRFGKSIQMTTKALITRIVFLQKNRCLPLLGIKKTQKCILLCYKGNNLKNIHARAMVLVHDTSSISEILSTQQGSIREYGRTDRRTQGEKQYAFQVRDIITKHAKLIINESAAETNFFKRFFQEHY